MADPRLVAVEHDPFTTGSLQASPERPAQPRMVPVEHDPFAAPQSGAGPSTPPTLLQDVVKSAAGGLAKGVLGIGSLPGNIEQLGRMGVDAGARALGYQDPKLRESWWLPGYQQYKDDAEKRLGLKIYEPQTTPGKYVDSVAQMAAAGPAMAGSLPQRVGAVVGSGVAAEAAGQATKGTALEPVARVAAGLAGAAAPNLLARSYTPVATSAERQQAVQTLRGEGVTDLTAGQVTGSKSLRYLESHASDIPFSGGRAAQMAERQAEQFTRAALRRAGVDEPHIAPAIQAAGGNANRTSTETMGALAAALGNRFETLAQRSQAQLAMTDRRAMADIVNNYERVVSPQARSPAVRGWLDDINGHAGNPIPGNVYGSYRSQIEADARALQKGDPLGAQALRNIRSRLDDVVERGLPVNERGQWQQARTHWRNLLILEKAAAAGGENAAMGLITPAQLRIATQNIDGRRNYVRGGQQMSDLARAGVAVMSQLPNSGTPARMMVGQTLGSIGAAGGALAGGVPGAAMSAIAAPVATGILARAFMSGPMQRYLGANARMAPSHLPMAPARGLLAAPLLSEALQ